MQSARLTATLVTDTDAVEAGHRSSSGCGCGWRRAGTPTGRTRATPASPPEVALTLPQGTSAGPIAWPAPQRLPEGPVMTYAYTGEVVLPITVTPGPGRADDHGQGGLAGLRADLRAGGGQLHARPAGRARGAVARRRRCSPPSDARLPRPSPFAAQIAPDGTLSLAGRRAVAGDGAGCLVLPRDVGAGGPGGGAEGDGAGRRGADRAHQGQRVRAERRRCRAWSCCVTPRAPRAS